MLDSFNSTPALVSIKIFGHALQQNVWWLQKVIRKSYVFQWMDQVYIGDILIFGSLRLS